MTFLVLSPREPPGSLFCPNILPIQLGQTVLNERGP
jgi:hypothetical protein